MPTFTYKTVTVTTPNPRQYYRRDVPAGDAGKLALSKWLALNSVEVSKKAAAAFNRYNLLEADKARQGLPASPFDTVEDYLDSLTLQQLTRGVMATVAIRTKKTGGKFLIFRVEDTVALPASITKIDRDPAQVRAWIVANQEDPSP